MELRGGRQPRARACGCEGYVADRLSLAPRSTSRFASRCACPGRVGLAWVGWVPRTNDAGHRVTCPDEEIVFGDRIGDDLVNLTHKAEGPRPLQSKAGLDREVGPYQMVFSHGPIWWSNLHGFILSF